MLYVDVGLRILLGAVFLASALGKLAAPRQFVVGVMQYQILPTRLASVYGWTLPFIQLAVAILLLTGIGVQWASLLAILMLGSFVGAVGIALARHQHLNCSCFGLLYRERVSLSTLLRDCLLGGIALFVLVTDDGAHSLPKLMAEISSTSSVIIISLSSLVVVAIGSLTALAAKERVYQ